MQRVQKSKKELELLLLQKEKESKNISLKEHINQISFLTQKRQRSPENSSETEDENKEKNNSQKDDKNDSPNANSNPSESNANKAPEKVVKINDILNKVLSISDKNNSYSKCFKLLNTILLKIKSQKENRLFYLLKLFYHIMFSSYKNNPKENLKEYINIYDKAKEFIAAEEKDLDEYELFEVLEFYIKIEPKLYNDDSFVFNSSQKEVFENLIKLNDYNDKEEIHINNFLNGLKGEECSIKMEDGLIVAIKRKLCFNILKNMSIYSLKNMHVYIKQTYKNIVTEYSKKLSEKMCQEIKERNAILNSGNASYKNTLKFSALDNKIKNNPSENYYNTQDARDEKLILGNETIWSQSSNEAKVNQIFLK